MQGQPGDQCGRLVLPGRDPRVQALAPRIPGVLIAVAGATVAVGMCDPGAKAGISVVGPLPQGLPVCQIPAVSFSEMGSLLASAVAIALISFAETSVLARTFALRGGYEVDDNQELIALGAANVAAGFFQGFSVEQQRFAHPGGRSGRREDAGHRRSGRSVRWPAVGLCAAVAAQPAPRRNSAPW